jgi:hypothetical protein
LKSVADAFTLNVCDNDRMAERRKKRPRDPLALAKMIGDIATGQASDTELDDRNPAVVEMGVGRTKGRSSASETIDA